MSRKKHERAVPIPKAGARGAAPLQSPRWTQGLLPYLLALGILSAIVLLAYVASGVLHGPFVFDDSNVVSSRLVRVDRLSQLSALVSARGIPRKLGMATFALNHMAGGFDPFGYHLVNLILHVLNGLLLFHLAWRVIAALPSHRWQERAPLVALFGAAVWVAHPVQTQAVSYIWQRFTELAALFYLAALVLYVEGRLRRKRWCFVAAFALYLVALLTKENTAVLPIMVLLVELLLLGRRDDALPRRRLMAGAGAAVVICALVAGVFLGPRALRKMSAAAENRGFTITERLLTQPRVVAHYVSLLVLPLPSRLNLDYDFPKSTSLMQPWTTPVALAGVLAALVLALHQWRRRPLLSFAILWFLGNLVIESSFVPLDMVYEHRLYLPSMIPIVLACGWLLHLRWPIKTAVTVGLGLVLALTLASGERNRVWADDLVLWKDNAAKSPGKARAWGNLGKTYQERGQFTEAKAAFERTLELDPKQVRAYNNLALIYLNQLEQPQKARELLEQGLALDPEDAACHVNLGVACNRTGDYECALKHLQIAFDHDPDAPQSFHNLALAYYHLKRYPRALELLQEAVARFPGEPGLRGLMGEVYRGMGDEQRAREAFQWAEVLLQQQRGRP